jgi:hypothetical protein
MPALFTSLSERLRDRSDVVLVGLERGTGLLVLGWVFLIAAGAAARLSGRVDDPLAWMPYALLSAGPALALAGGLAFFNGVRPARAIASHPLYGANGLMLSLLLTVLAAMLLRGVSFLAALPPVAAGESAWLGALHGWLTVDALLICSLYGLAFAAGLRRSPSFPALLAIAWSADLALQLLMAGAAGGMALPPAVADAFGQLLQGNLARTLVSVAIWLPYLLLSERVAVTYRHHLRPRVA